MVKDTVEFVEAMNGGEVFIAITQMVLANLCRRITHGFEQLRNGGVTILETFREDE